MYYTHSGYWTSISGKNHAYYIQNLMVLPSTPILASFRPCLWAVKSVGDCVVLEGEMYQLSHLLTDQKTVMTSMMELSLTGNKGLLAVSWLSLCCAALPVGGRIRDCIHLSVCLCLSLYLSVYLFW